MWIATVPAIFYVISLYLFRGSTSSSKEEPIIIKKRFVSVLLTSAVSATIVTVISIFSANSLIYSSPRTADLRLYAPNEMKHLIETDPLVVIRKAFQIVSKMLANIGLGITVHMQVFSAILVLLSVGFLFLGPLSVYLLTVGGIDFRYPGDQETPENDRRRGFKLSLPFFFFRILISPSKIFGRILGDFFGEIGKIFTVSFGLDDSQYSLNYDQLVMLRNLIVVRGGKRGRERERERERSEAGKWKPENADTTNNLQPPQYPRVLSRKNLFSGVAFASCCFSSTSVRSLKPWFIPR